MILDLFHIVLIFIFLTILLLITTIYSRIYWQLKAVLIIFSVFFYLSSYNTVHSLLGRPTVQEVEENSVLLIYLAEKPQGQSSGRILLLVRDKLDFRLHQVPYNEELLKKLQNASRASQQGGGIPGRIILRNTGSLKMSAGDLNITIVNPDIPEK